MMQRNMSVQVWLGIEVFLTQGASEWFLLGVMPHVRRQIEFWGKRFATNCTGEPLFTMDTINMSTQILFSSKCFVTQGAGEILGFFMHSINVYVQILSRCKWFVTKCARERFQFIMHSINMCSQLCFIGKWPLTQCAGEMFLFAKNSIIMYTKVWLVCKLLYNSNYFTLVLLHLKRKGFLFDILLS